MAEITGVPNVATAAPRPRAEERAETVERPRRNHVFRIITYLVLSAAALIYIAPFVWMLSRSVMNQAEANSAIFLPTDFRLQNYAEVWSGTQSASSGDVRRAFGTYLWNTVRLEVITVTLQTLVSLFAAYAFARMKFPGRDMLFGLFLMTIFVPSVILLVPNLVTVTRLSQASVGACESILTGLGVQVTPQSCSGLKWLDNWPALVFPFLASTFSIFLLRQFFKQIPEDLWDAARIDGAGHTRFLFQVVVPISRAPVLTTVLLSFIGVWSALEWPILVTSSDAWRPIAVALQQYRTEGGQQTQYIMAASVIALLPILALYFITQKQFTEGIATTGLK
jgi:ABC-type glycerol-3-phosphate transport system permease component